MLTHNRMLNDFPTFFCGGCVYQPSRICGSCGASVAFLGQLIANIMIFTKVET